MTPAIEVKRYPDGRRQEFACELVHRARDVMVLRYVLPARIEAGGLRFAAGSVTYGVYWRRRPYVLYAMRDRGGRPAAYRFDVAGEVRLRRDRVEYLDLALDVWVDLSGRAWLEDEAEAESLAASGLISRERLESVRRTGRYLLARGRLIAAEVEAAYLSAARA